MLHGLRLAVTLVGKNSFGVFQHLADNVLKPSKELGRPSWGYCEAPPSDGRRQEDGEDPGH